MDRPLRLLVGVLVPILALMATNWFDADVLRATQESVQRTFSSADIGAFGDQLTLAHLLTAACAIAVAVAAWRARSVWLSAVYVIVGAFIVGLPLIEYNFVNSIPQPVRGFVIVRWRDSVRGLTGSVLTVGAAMVVCGVAVIVSIVLVGRRTSNEPGNLPVPTAPTPDGSAG